MTDKPKTARVSEADRLAQLSVCYAVRDCDSTTSIAAAFRAALPVGQADKPARIADTVRAIPKGRR